MTIELVDMKPGNDPQRVNVTLKLSDDIPVTGFIRSATVKVDVPRSGTFDEIFLEAKKEAFMFLHLFENNLS